MVRRGRIFLPCVIRERNDFSPSSTRVVNRDTSSSSCSMSRSYRISARCVSLDLRRPVRVPMPKIRPLPSPSTAARSPARRRPRPSWPRGSRRRRTRARSARGRPWSRRARWRSWVTLLEAYGRSSSPSDYRLHSCCSGRVGDHLKFSLSFKLLDPFEKLAQSLAVVRRVTFSEDCNTTVLMVGAHSWRSFEPRVLWEYGLEVDHADRVVIDVNMATQEADAGPAEPDFALLHESEPELVAEGTEPCASLFDAHGSSVFFDSISASISATCSSVRRSSLEIGRAHV